MPLYGPKFPLSAGNSDAFQLYESVEQQIGFYLKNLILTSPGENISDSNYGVGLRSFLFEQNTPDTYGRISANVASQISRYLPYLSVSNIETGATDVDIDNYSIFLRITYSIPGDVNEKVFELDINPDTMIGFY
jgi:phage baseplate assembly protein W